MERAELSKTGVSMLGRLFLFFLICPVLELLVLVKIHRYLKPELGSGQALLIIIAGLIVSCMVGIRVAKVQGIRLLLETQQRLQQGALPQDKLLEGLLLVMAGIAFIIPGFLSDGLGLILLLPIVRRLLAKKIKIWLTRSMDNGQFKVYQQGVYRHTGTESTQSSVSHSHGDIIDVEAIDSQSTLKAP